jgi:PTS system nitrogen regulatory IIA component
MKIIRSFTGNYRSTNMKVIDALHPDAILTDMQSRTKKEVLEEISKPIARILKIRHEDLVKVLIEREQMGSTGIGKGIAIPHGRISGINDLVIGFGLSRKGAQFDSLDKTPVHIFFVLVTPEHSTGLYLKFLARISRMLKNEAVKEKLLHARQTEDIISAIRDEDEDS